MRPPRSRPSCLLAAALVAALAGGCGARARESEPSGDASFRGPIVIVSFAALSAGAVGGPASLTPQLDRFIAEASWSGRGVASASWAVGSLGSVLTGMPPSIHGACHPAHPRLRPQVETLAEALSAAGFPGRAFYGNPWAGPGSGLERGFEASRPLHRQAAARWLAKLPPGASFTFVELGLPGPSVVAARTDGDHDQATPAEPTADDSTQRRHPKRRRPGAHAAVRQKNAAARQKSAAARQESAAVRQGLGDAARDPYRRRVEQADLLFGELLAALRDGDRYDQAVVIVLADHGDPALEGGAAPPGLSLARAAVEVPLAIRVPEALRPRLEVPAAATVGLDRIHATVLELAGLRAPVPAAPSLLRPSEWVAVSELWLGNGYHEVGVFEDGHQLRWRCRFAPAAPDFDATWRGALGGEGGPAYGETFARLDAAFRSSLACPEGEELVLEAWSADGAAPPVDDPARRDRLLARLRSLRHFPPAFAVAPAPAWPVVGRRNFQGLAGWGLPLPSQWLADQGPGADS